MQKLAIRNIYDLMAEQIVQHTDDIDQLHQLIESKGLSSSGMYRVEIWSFCRALEKLHHDDPNDCDMLMSLERKLLSEIDFLSTSEHHEEQLRREMLPVMSSGQLTFCQKSAERDSIRRVQISSRSGQTDAVRGLRIRMARAIVRQRDQTPIDDAVVTLAINRALTAAMADFDVPSMVLCRIAFKLFVHESDNEDDNDQDFIACSDQTEFRDCHFVVSDGEIDMLRCGVFKVEAIPSAASPVLDHSSSSPSASSKNRPVYIPFCRRVTIPISVEHLRMREDFRLLSGRCHKTLQKAAKWLPSSGVPKPLIDWAQETPEFVEQQLQLLANGVRHDETGEWNVRLGVETNKSSNDRRLRRCLARTQSTKEKKKSPSGHHVDELLAATTQLVLANNDMVLRDDEMNREKTEQMLSLRQDVMRSLRQWMDSLELEKDADLENGNEWRNILKEEFLYALRGLEDQVMNLVTKLLHF